jgi:hypothetical protein
MTLRIRLTLMRTRNFYEHRRAPITIAPWRGGLHAQRGHCIYRKLSERQ